MANLIPLSPCDGLLPLTVGNVTVTEVWCSSITSVAPFKGQAKAASDTLKAALGVGIPAVNRTVAKGGVRCVWAGAGLTMVIDGVVPDLSGQAAVTDQTDGWAVVAVEGAGAEAVLARLVPIDLRAGHFKTGHAARTLLGHMTCGIARTAAQRFEVMVMRSMAATLVHDLDTAARGVAARVALAD